MKSMGTISYSQILRIITDICIIVNAVSLIGLFWIARLLVDYLTDVFGWSEPYWFILAFFYVCGAMTLGILL